MSGDTGKTEHKEHVWQKENKWKYDKLIPKHNSQRVQYKWSKHLY